jgi:hypothetical protein
MANTWWFIPHIHNCKDWSTTVWGGEKCRAETLNLRSQGVAVSDINILWFCRRQETQTTKDRAILQISSSSEKGKKQIPGVNTIKLNRAWIVCKKWTNTNILK